MKHLPYVFLTFFLFTIAFAQDEFLVQIPLNEQVELSSAIVEGKVISKTSYWDEDRKNIYTVHNIEISKVYKGGYVQQIHLVTLGGIVDFEVQISRPNLDLKTGDSGVFLTEPFDLKLDGFQSSVPIYRTLGVSQGFYRYHTENSKVTNPFLSFSNSQNLEDNLLKFTKEKLIHIKPKNLSVKKKTPPKPTISGQNAVTISAIEPTQIVAGNGSIITISGSNFGSTKAEVYFKNANDAGATEILAIETNIVSWTETEIKVKVPGGAGTGTIRVRNTATNTESISSRLLITDNYITTRYADSNSITNIQGGKEVEYRLHHIGLVTRDGNPIGDFDNGAYLFKYHTDFKNNNQAVTAFENGFNDIVCSAGIDFKISEISTTAKTPAADNINSIAFDAVQSGVLGQVNSRGNAKYTYDSTTGEFGLYFFFYEFDYVFDENQTWDFDLDGQTTTSEFDFNAVVRHETGHAAGLGHVIDNQKIMHYALSPGPKQNISSNTIYSPVIAKITQDKATPVPSDITATDFSNCYINSLAIEKFEDNSFAVFPNPAKNKLKINGNNLIDLVKIYNIYGAITMTLTPKEKTTSLTVDVSTLSTGPYILYVEGHKKRYNIKFYKY